jgi:hypothetical protein
MSNPGEVRPLVAQLAKHQVRLPASGSHAAAVMAALEDEALYSAYRLPALADLSPETLDETLRDAAVALGTETDRRNIGSQLHQSASDVVAQSLIDGLDEVLDQLRGRFDRAAAVISAAHKAGLRADSDADSAISLGAKGVEAWQQLSAACATLDDIADLRLAIAKVTGEPPYRDQHSGAFCSDSGLWNSDYRKSYRRSNRWLLLADSDGPKLNSALETEQACLVSGAESTVPSGPSYDEATLRTMLGQPAR